MSKIAKEDMTTLFPASESKTVAAGAEKESQIAEVAFAINSAANCGQTCVTFNTKLRDDVKQELLDKGYKITQSVAVEKSRFDLPIIISWKEA